MSWHYLQGQEEVFWEGNSLDGAPSALSRLIPTAVACCLHDNGTACSISSQSGTMCARSTEDHGEAMSMLSAVDSPARTLALPDAGKESKVQEAGSGQKWRASFARYDRSTCSWKTFQHSLLGGLAEYSATWPRWGLMLAGECWELQKLVPPTGVTESGLWPTPHANCSTGPGASGRQGGLNLQTAVTLFPTPTVQGNYNRKGLSKTSGDGLATVAMKFPTPAAQDAKNSTLPISQKNRDSIPGHLLRAGEQPGGQLNPMWVEWLMGWPIGWSDLEPLAMGKFQRWLRQHGKY